MNRKRFLLLAAECRIQNEAILGFGQMIARETGESQKCEPLILDRRFLRMLRYVRNLKRKFTTSGIIKMYLRVKCAISPKGEKGAKQKCRPF